MASGRRMVAGLLVAAALLATAACSSPTAAPSGTAASRPPDVVDVKGFAFVPARLTVRQGTVIRYVNGDRAEHTVTEGADGDPTLEAAFDAPLAIGATAPISFASPGEVKVTCRIHPTMNQTVVVEPG